MIRALAFALMLPFTVQAQEAGRDLSVDYEALFRDKADLVRDETRADGPDTRVLDLPGNVTVTAVRNEEATDYIAIDRSPEGAVGCLIRIVVDLRRVGPCDGVISAEQATRIAAVFDRLLAFHVVNTWPPLAPAEQPRAMDEIRQTLNRNDPPAAAVCAGLDDSARRDVARMAGSIGGENVMVALEQVLAVPRLPVTNPCL